MENQPQAAPSGSKSTIWIIILVVVLIVAGGAYYFLAQDDGTNTNSTNNVNAGVNSVVNANANANEVTNGNVNSETNTNTTVDTSSWEKYVNSTYHFSISYPLGLERWESSLSPAVTNQRADGLVFDTGFRPTDYQGSLFLMRISTQSLQELTANNPQEFGQVSGTMLESGVNSWTQLTGAEMRYGIERGGYSIIVELQDTSTDYNISTLREMLSTVQFTQ